MTHQGMVHALKEIWRVLRKNGVLIDLRPLHSNITLESCTGEQSDLITCYTRESLHENDVAADKAMSIIVNQRYFELLDSISFEYIKLYDTGEELLEYYAERNPPIVQPEHVIGQIKLADNNPAMTLRLGTPMLLKTYRRIEPSG